MPETHKFARAAGLQTLVQGFLQILYPNSCWMCRKSVAPNQHALCSECHNAVFTDPRPSCPRCAATVGPFAQTDEGCLACRDKGFAFDSALRLGPYEGLLREAVLRIKSAYAEPLAEIIASEWASRVRDSLRASGVQTVVPVPLHWWRRWRRGCNQSDALARALAKKLEVPVYCSALRRGRATAMQTQLSTTARRENVRGAFMARRTANVAKKVVLLVDDVMTTGSTAHEASRALRQAEAAKVIVAVLARAEE